MKRAFRYNGKGKRNGRPPRGFVRWLSFWCGAAALLLRTGRLSGRLVWTEDASGELLAAGFPSLLAVPESLFAQTAVLFPARVRLRAARTEEDCLAALRLVETACGESFDWDAFLAACEKRNRGARRLRAAAEKLFSLAPVEIDARTPSAALRSLLQKERK